MRWLLKSERLANSKGIVQPRPFLVGMAYFKYRIVLMIKV